MSRIKPHKIEPKSGRIQEVFSKKTRYLFKILGVAAAYFVTAKISLLLAIPPGYATAVWPAAGIALAAALLYPKIPKF